jgi:chemotaxis protein MotB
MPRSPFLVAAALICAACVTTSTHEKGIADLDAQHQKELEAAKVEDAAKLAEAEKKLSETEQARKDLEKKLAEAQKRADELNKLLQGTAADKDKLGKLLQATNTQLEDLARQKAAADARAATYKALTDRLRSMIDAGKLSVRIRKGRMLISLPNDVLFDSGSAALKKAGQDAIGQVAQALAGFTDRQFLVAGHTDDKPIHSARFPSNWELSTERAVVVTRFLISKGLRPDSLGAVGYGEFDPAVPNDTGEHRAQNRRIEIQLQPNLSELPSMDDLARQ